MFAFSRAVILPYTARHHYRDNQRALLSLSQKVGYDFIASGTGAIPLS